MDRNQLINDTETAVRYALDGRQAEIWTAFPAIVTAVDLTDEMTLTAQPAIQGVVSNKDGTETIVNLPLLIHVPICFPSAGGFTLTFPLAVDDEVLVVIASRCIDSWWQNGGIGVPMEARMHDLSDGFAIPGPRSQPRKLTSISTTNVQLRNDAGTAYLEITPAGHVNVVSSQIGFTGNLMVTGNIVATGEVTAGIIPLTAHIHPGVTPGGSSTGAPLP